MRTCRIVDFALSVEYGVKIEENQRRDKYLDLIQELKKLQRY